MDTQGKKPERQDPYQFQSEEMRNFVDPLFAEREQPESLTEKSALTALICGIAALLFFCEWHISLILGIAAIVAGILSLKKHHEASRGYAWAGLIMGICACCVQCAVGLFPLLFKLLGGVGESLVPEDIT